MCKFFALNFYMNLELTFFEKTCRCAKKFSFFNIIIILLSKLVQAAKLVVSIRDMSGLHCSRETSHPYRGAEL